MLLSLEGLEDGKVAGGIYIPSTSLPASPPGLQGPVPTTRHGGTYGHCWRCRCTSNLEHVQLARSPCRWCSPLRVSHQGVQIRTRGSELAWALTMLNVVGEVCPSRLMSQRLMFRNSAHHQGPINPSCAAAGLPQRHALLGSAPVSRTQRSGSPSPTGPAPATDQPNNVLGNQHK
jgi:hypothetical protein